MGTLKKHGKIALGIIAIIVGIVYFYYKTNKQNEDRDKMIKSVFESRKTENQTDSYGNSEYIDTLGELTDSTFRKNNETDADLIWTENELRKLLKEKLGDEYNDNLETKILFNNYLMKQKIEKASPDIIVLSFNYFSKAIYADDITTQKNYDDLSMQLFFLIESNSIYKYSLYYNKELMADYYHKKVRNW